ncbi:MAG: TolC family protein [Candidatus Hydrogenedentes bacterium]|nr:TolC family protein [Candidatus Hydrogenedentota bacterium]
MRCTRRLGWALTCLLCALALTSGIARSAEPSPISISDWKKDGAQAEKEDAPPAEAFLPALEPEQTSEPAIETTPLPPVQDAAIHDSPEPALSAKPEAPAGGPVMEEASTVAPGTGEAAEPRTVHAWVDPQNAPPANGVNEAAQGSDISQHEIKAGQIRTPSGVINLQAITLDRLHEEVAQQTDREEVPLSLQECVTKALESNQDILVTAYEPLKAESDIMQAKGEFDPVLKSVYSRSHSENTASSQTNAFTGGSLGGSSGSGLLGNLGGSSSLLSGLGGNGLLSGLGNNNNGDSNNFGRLLLYGAINLLSKAGSLIQQWLPGRETSYVIESDNWRSETSVYGKVPWGTQYELKMEVNEEQSTFNSFVSEFSGGLTLTLTQPLLRGRGSRANLARIRIAKNNREAAESQVMQQVMTTLSEVVKAYWDLVGAHRQLEVREKSLANAERLLKINERRMEIGTGAALEVVQAKASVAQRQGDVISARSQVLSAEDRLKLLLDMRNEGVFSAVRFMPTDMPEATELDLDETASINLAMAHRPEMLSAQLEIDSAEIERYRAANEMLPQLDVAGSVFQGARGSKAGDVWEGVTERDDNSWSLSVTGSVPITNRSGRGAYTSAALSKRQAEDRLEKTITELTLNVRNALRGVGTSRILVESSRQARALQETNVMAEEKRLTLGVTTSFEVLQVQEDLANAEAQEVQALIDFEKSKVDLELAEGVTLQSLGVEYEMPQPEKPVSFLRSIVPPAPKD